MKKKEIAIRIAAFRCNMSSLEIEQRIEDGDKRIKSLVWHINRSSKPVLCNRLRLMERGEA